VAEDARLIREEVARCRRILDRMNRDSTGGAEEEPQPTSGAEIATQISTQLRPAETARLVITDQTAGMRWRLPRVLLAQSVANLVKNGCEASPAVAPVELRLQAEAGVLVIEVRDGGSGIAAADCSRLGEPFFTTKPPGQGMGLGLFLVRLFAQRVNGSLEFESEPGRFTIARLRLPFPIA
jgi:two-component system sensor histidine kinase RegB